jgi:AbrB family looped-hinge helix DNA binding protein
MPIAESKITSQGQISVPAEIRRKLGVGPGSTIAWEEDGDQIVVRRAKKYTSEDIRRAGFPEGPPQKVATIEQMKQAIGRGISERYARSRH